MSSRLEKFSLATNYSILLILITSSCSNAVQPLNTDNSDECSTEPTPYVLNLPDHIPHFDTPRDNMTTVEGVEYGRKLYYDKNLSTAGGLKGKSCSSCHLQKNSFSNNSSGTSVLLHTNLNWTTFFLWDGKIDGSLEDVMEFEIVDFFEADIEKYKNNKDYQEMNCSAFGSKVVSAGSMAKAMAQWMRVLVSYRSKYDNYMAGNIELSNEELTGKFLFEGSADCISCHPLPLTTDHSFHNNGLDEFNQPTDLKSSHGRYEVTGDPVDLGVFKTPTLRNIELTTPYMHDGRFQTLTEVVQHYNRQVKWSSSLDIVMLTADPARINEFGMYGLDLSDSDVEAIVAFLKTFTDPHFIDNPDLSDPFE